MLGACLQSLLDQDYDSGKTRIIVVDNGSTDSTREVYEQFPVELLKEDRPGPAAARNRGLRSGSGELVAFFDGHCIANRGWVSAMVSRFVDSRFAGSQAKLEHKATDPLVKLYLENTRATDPKKVLGDTLRGERNIYPWVLSGNCMFTRAVLRDVGGFDETLPACEDVDISWKVVLSGYLLDYAPDACVVHWNNDSWDSFILKSYAQGRGAAALAHRYLRHGARNVFEPLVPDGLGPELQAIARHYQMGYEYEEQRITAGESNPAANLPNVRTELRKLFQWSSDTMLSISVDAVYWLRDDSQSIVIHHPSESRIVLDGTADFVWRRLALGWSRDAVAIDISRRYRLTPEAAARDCDDFVHELMDHGVLIRHGR